MSSSPESPHLDNHHRTTLRQIFDHPVSRNIERHAVTSLLDAIGTVTVHGGKVPPPPSDPICAVRGAWCARA